MFGEEHEAQKESRGPLFTCFAIIRSVQRKVFIDMTA